MALSRPGLLASQGAGGICEGASEVDVASGVVVGAVGVAVVVGRGDEYGVWVALCDLLLGGADDLAELPDGLAFHRPSVRVADASDDEREVVLAECCATAGLARRVRHLWGRSRSGCRGVCF